MRGLLDVNVLLALLDRKHVHHLTAYLWLEANLHAGWATCPLILWPGDAVRASIGDPGRGGVRDAETTS